VEPHKRGHKWGRTGTVAGSCHNPPIDQPEGVLMLSLAEAANQPVRRDPRMRCGVEVWMRTLEPTERAGAEKLIRQARDFDRTVPDVWGYFAAHGFPHTLNVVQVHKSMKCSCFR
jgi:hypothetical protein